TLRLDRRVSGGDRRRLTSRPPPTDTSSNERLPRDLTARDVVLTHRVLVARVLGLLARVDRSRHAVRIERGARGARGLARRAREVSAVNAGLTRNGDRADAGHERQRERERDCDAVAHVAPPIPRGSARAGPKPRDMDQLWRISLAALASLRNPR